MHSARKLGRVRTCGRDGARRTYLSAVFGTVSLKSSKTTLQSGEYVRQRNWRLNALVRACPRACCRGRCRGTRGVVTWPVAGLFVLTTTTVSAESLAGAIWTQLRTGKAASVGWRDSRLGLVGKSPFGFVPLSQNSTPTSPYMSHLF